MTICVLATSALEVRPEDVGMRFKSFFDRNRVLPLRELCQEVNGDVMSLVLGKLSRLYVFRAKRGSKSFSQLTYIVCEKFLN